MNPTAGQRQMAERWQSKRVAREKMLDEKWVKQIEKRSRIEEQAAMHNIQFDMQYMAMMKKKMDTLAMREKEYADFLHSQQMDYEHRLALHMDDAMTKCKQPLSVRRPAIQ